MLETIQSEPFETVRPTHNHYAKLMRDLNTAVTSRFLIRPETNFGHWLCLRIWNPKFFYPDFEERTSRSSPVVDTAPARNVPVRTV